MFRTKYHSDNELIKAPVAAQEDIMKMIAMAQKGQSKSGIRGAVIAAACLIMAAAAALTAVFAGIRQGVPQDVIPAVSMGDAHYAADYAELYSVIESFTLQDGFNEFYGAVPEAEGSIADNLGAVFNSASDSAAAGTGSTSGYSQTNVQVEGVDEADIIKTDGAYIYRMSGQSIAIIDPHSMSLVCRFVPQIQTDAEKETGCNIWISDIYLWGDRLAVLYTGNRVSSEDELWKSVCGAAVYDISDRTAPQQLCRLEQDGDLVSSRLIGSQLYLISSYYVWNEPEKSNPETYIPCFGVDGSYLPVAPGDICITGEPTAPSYTVITSADISTGERFDSIEAILGQTSTVYADSETVLLGYTERRRESIETQADGQNATVVTMDPVTHILRFSIAGGDIVPAGECVIPGELLNQFSLDRKDGIIRAVTTSNTWKQTIFTDGIDRHEFESSQSNGLYTIDDSMNIMGRLEGLAPDETVYSVRFIGDMGYFVTFRQIDPLFAVDLSDPAAPVILSELKIPGFSQYMHPYAPGLLFGLGLDADEETGRTGGLKLSMFDISDPTCVVECSKLILEQSWSEALHDHKAIVIDAERNIIAFPYGTGYAVYGYGEGGFTLRCELESPELGKFFTSLRGLFIGESFYICNECELYRYDIDTFEAEGSLAFASEEDIYPEYYFID